jgi:hypothetical protein
MRIPIPGRRRVPPELAASVHARILALPAPVPGSAGNGAQARAESGARPEEGIRMHHPDESEKVVTHDASVEGPGLPRGRGRHKAASGTSGRGPAPHRPPGHAGSRPVHAPPLEMTSVPEGAGPGAGGPEPRARPQPEAGGRSAASTRASPPESGSTAGPWAGSGPATVSGPLFGPEQLTAILPQPPSDPDAGTGPHPDARTEALGAVSGAADGEEAGLAPSSTPAPRSAGSSPGLPLTLRSGRLALDRPAVAALAVVGCVGVLLGLGVLWQARPEAAPVPPSVVAPPPASPLVGGA